MPCICTILRRIENRLCMNKIYNMAHICHNATKAIKPCSCSWFTAVISFWIFTNRMNWLVPKSSEQAFMEGMRLKWVRCTMEICKPVLPWTILLVLNVPRTTGALIRPAAFGVLYRHEFFELQYLAILGMFLRFRNLIWHWGFKGRWLIDVSVTVTMLTYRFFPSAS